MTDELNKITNKYRTYLAELEEEHKKKLRQIEREEFWMKTIIIVIPALFMLASYLYSVWPSSKPPCHEHIVQTQYAGDEIVYQECDK